MFEDGGVTAREGPPNPPAIGPGEQAQMEKEDRAENQAGKGEFAERGKNSGLDTARQSDS